MIKTTVLVPMAAATVLLIGSPAAKALVALDSTYSFDLIGANTNGSAYYLVNAANASFGVPATATGPEGQTVTITSSETVGVSTTTDTFTMSTPSNFITADSVQGTTINLLQFDVGDLNSGAAVTTLAPIGMYSAVGTVTDGTGATLTTTTLPANDVTTMIGGNDMSYGVAEGVNTGSPTTPIDSYDVHEFTYSITYQTLPPAPEPSSWALLGIGAASGVIMFLRRKRA